MDAEPVPVPLIFVVNEEDKGGQIGLVTSDGDVLLSLSQLREIGLVSLPDDIAHDGKSLISLLSLSSGLSFALDLNQLEVKITASPLLLETWTLDLRKREPPGIIHSERNSAFLNYALDFTLDEEGTLAAMSVPWEVAVRLGRTLAYSGFQYSQSDEGAVERKQSVRLISNLVWDLPSGPARLTAGDFAADSGRLGSAGIFAGLSFARNFSLTPYLIKSPTMGLSGLLTTASLVEVYVNGLRIVSEKFAAGQFNILHLLGGVGAGDITIVITDAFQRTQTIAIPVYVSEELLAPELHEYSYNLGYTRENFGLDSDEYGDPAFMVVHRYGFTDWLTAGFRAEAGSIEADSSGSESVGMANGGITATLLLWRAGEVSLGLANSYQKELDKQQALTGSAGFLGFQYLTKRASFTMSGQAYDRNYVTLSLPAYKDRPRLIRSARAGITVPVLGSFSVAHTINDSYEGGDIRSTSIFYNQMLTKQASLSVSSSQTTTDFGDHQETNITVAAGINVTFGTRDSAHLNQQKHDGSTFTSVGVQRSSPAGIGFGYSLDLERSKTSYDGVDKEVDAGRALLKYQGSRGEYSVAYTRVADIETTNLNASGAVSLIDGSLNLSRPILDAFALVRVDGIEDVRIYSNNQETGSTRSDGTIVVPNLISYLGNRISIEEQDIGVDRRIDTLDQSVAPPYRGGSVIDFKLARIQAIVGKLYYMERGQKFTADLSGLALEVVGKVQEFVVGKGGELYLENIPPGSYAARLYDKNRECRLGIVIPKTDDMIVDLGEIVCEID